MQVRAYVRVSTEEQAEEGFSIPTQRQRIGDFCRSQWGPGARVAWYVDDGCSARDMARPALAQLRAEAAPGDVVVVLRLDRLTRSVLDLYTLLREWDARRVFFRSVTEPYDTGSTEGRFMIGLLALLAEWERLRIGERVREVMANIVRTEQRHLGRAPLGYDLVDGRLVVNEPEAAVVRRIFALYAREHGTRAIAAQLNRQGVRTRLGAEWTDFAVSYVLRNPVYCGKVAWSRVVSRGRRGGRAGGGEPILVDGAHTPLVAPETWAAVQATLARRRRIPNRAATGQYPATGLVVCGLCGSPVHGFTQRRYQGGRPVPGREQAYYRCARRDHRGTCTLPYFRAAALEGAVLAAMGPLAGRETLRGVVRALLAAPDDTRDRREAAALAAELRLLARRRDRWDRAYADGDLTRAEWKERTLPLREREAAVRQALGAPAAGAQAAPGPDEVLLAVADLPGVWAHLAPGERKTLLHGLLQQGRVFADGRVEVVPRALPNP